VEERFSAAAEAAPWRSKVTARLEAAPFQNGGGALSRRRLSQFKTATARAFLISLLML